MARFAGKSDRSANASGDRFDKLMQYLLKRRRRTLRKAKEVESEVEDARREIQRGARRTDHRFRL